jgi:hypothetical protein
MTCSTIPTTYSSSQLSCYVIQATLQALFPLDSTLTITRSLNTTLSPGGVSTLNSAGLVSGDGQLWAQLWYSGEEQFYCQAGGCTQTVASVSGSSTNSSTWVCPTLDCVCRPGTTFCGGETTVCPGISLIRSRREIGMLTPTSQNLAGPINTMTGPLTVDCLPTGTCSFQQTFLQALFGVKGLELSSCSFGECVQQYAIDQAIGVAAIDSSNGLSGGVIAGLAVVGALILAVLALIIWGLIKRKQARNGVSAMETLGKSGGVGITWSGVGYEVKPSRSTFVGRAGVGAEG